MNILFFLFAACFCRQYHKLRKQLSNDKPQFDVGSWWTDTNGTFIQGHGGNIEHIDDYDCFNNGTKGCWVWHGEDKNQGTTGVHCYASTNLYVWEDKGFSLNIHNIVPERLNGLKNGIVPDLDNLRELKRRANLPKANRGSTKRSNRPKIQSTSNNDVTDDDIDFARNFLKAYVTEIDKDGKYVKYDETNLIVGYRYLYKSYCIIERPKMLYNKKYNNYVMLFHADGPNDQQITDWLNSNMSYSLGGKYSRAMLGFAISNSPFGPFKIVNVQRMHWCEGCHTENPGMARDMGTYIDRNEEDEDIAYAIYSSEENQYMYISRLDDTFTTWDVPQGEAKDGIDFKSHLLGDKKSREAPAIFRHKGYYYLMTSGCTGWSPNPATFHRSSMLFGPYEEVGNPCQGDGSDRTFDSQSTYFIRYNAEKGQFIYFGDRWWENDLPESRYVLLPVELDDKNHKFTLHYTEHWSLEDVFSSNSDDNE